MQTIWLGLVGPGISAQGVDSKTFADQVDLRPTLMALTGLHDDYRVDGRVLTQALDHQGLPRALQSDQHTVAELGAVYKQIDAVDGQFAAATLAASTRGIASGSATNDSTYTATEAALSKLEQSRDRIASEIQNALLGAEFGNHPIGSSANALIWQADQLLAQANHLAKG
jgi:hypothetical protein